jgi:hypothetical protein
MAAGPDPASGLKEMNEDSSKSNTNLQESFFPAPDFRHLTEFLRIIQT